MPKTRETGYHEQVTTIGQLTGGGAWHIGTTELTLCGRRWLTSRAIALNTDPFTLLGTYAKSCAQCRQVYAAYAVEDDNA